MCFVLIVGDHRDTAESIAQLLRHHGHTATVLPRLEQPETVFTKLKPEMILLDFDSAGASGMDVLRMLKAYPGGAKVPVVMMSTTCVSPGVVQEARRIGASGWVEKAYDRVEKIIAEVRRLRPDISRPAT